MTIDDYRIAVNELDESSERKESVYLVLKRKIMNREFTPHERIDANEIAKELGISRTPVRDALNRLDTEGFIETLPRKGTFITGIFKEDLIQLFQFREMVELFMLELGFPKLVRSADKLEEQIGRWEAELDKENYDGNVFLESDVLLHSAIVQSGGNPRIFRAYEGMNCHVQMARGYYLQDKSRIAAAHAEHKAVLESILEHDLDETKRRMKTHLDNTLESLLAIINIYKVF